jgi:hypothetical protein
MKEDDGDLMVKIMKDPVLVLLEVREHWVNTVTSSDVTQFQTRNIMVFYRFCP